MKVSEDLIHQLKELKYHDTDLSYYLIKNILKSQTILMPFFDYLPCNLYRIRRHNKGEIFFEKSENLSYIKNVANIENFGRANEPRQGFFYCNDSFNQDTGLSEAISVFRGNDGSNEEIFTNGMWNVKKSLRLAVILPSLENLGKQSEFDEMKKIYYEFEQSEKFEELKTFLEFLSNEYTLDLQKDKSNYKITCAFSNYIKDNFPQVDGIIYGSVKMENKGTNIVLWPKTVDEKLEFVAARKSIFKRIINKTFCEIKTIDSKEYDKENDKIIWE